MGASEKCEWYESGAKKVCYTNADEGDSTKEKDNTSKRKLQKKYNRYEKEYTPFHVVDNVIIPGELEYGNYVLSWRWDNEQTPQVWSTCADIQVAESLADDSTETKAQSSYASSKLVL